MVDLFGLRNWIYTEHQHSFPIKWLHSFYSNYYHNSSKVCIPWPASEGFRGLKRKLLPYYSRSSVYYAPIIENRFNLVDWQPHTVMFFLSQDMASSILEVFDGRVLPCIYNHDVFVIIWPHSFSENGASISYLKDRFILFCKILLSRLYGNMNLFVAVRLVVVSRGTSYASLQEYQ